MVKKIVLYVMVWLGVVMGLSLDVVARDVSQSDWTPRRSERDVYLTESKLKQFHKVHKTVTKRTQKYHKKIQRAKSEKQKLKLAAKAQRDIVNIIERSPLSVAEYNQILKVLLGRESLR